MCEECQPEPMLMNDGADTRAVCDPTQVRLLSSPVRDEKAAVQFDDIPVQCGTSTLYASQYPKSTL